MTMASSKISRALTDDQKRVLRTLRTEGPRSRIELSRRLDLNGTAVTRACQTLITGGFILETEALRAARGRPSLPLEVRPGNVCAIGAALQPGTVDVALVDLIGRPIAKGGFDFADEDPSRFAAALAEEATRLIEASNLEPSSFLGYGVSVPGYVGLEEGRRHTVERLKSWRGLNLPVTLGRSLGARVWVENDANAAALAESYAAGRAGGDMLVFYLGHGVGGAAIVDGNLFRGAFGNAGEIGLLYPLDKSRPSAVDLLRRLEQSGAGPVTVADLADLMASRPDFFAEWALQAADQLEAAALSGVAWLDPASIVLSGVLPRPLLATMRDRLDVGVWRSRLDGRRQPVVSISDLGGFAGAIGAGLLPVHDLIGG
ncbi:MAG: ROK family protein [Alphaproteobacteria bacterium]|nr:ROK family protein [Alphaproteobacteria bacterium]MBU2379330.1 ROK family protein [Alphaproteobacteria bacterium]